MASVTPKKSTESPKHKHTKSKKEIEKEDTQLDNLFVTIESELQTNDEAKHSKPKSKHAKEPKRTAKNHKHHHHKHKHHTKKQEEESLVQIDHKHKHAKKHHGKKRHHSKHKKTHGSKHAKQEGSLLQLSADVSLGEDVLMGMAAEDKEDAALRMKSIGELQQERQDGKYAKSGLKEDSLANPLLAHGQNHRERKVPASTVLLQVGSQLSVEAQS